MGKRVANTLKRIEHIQELVHEEGHEALNYGVSFESALVVSNAISNGLDCAKLLLSGAYDDTDDEIVAHAAVSAALVSAMLIREAAEESDSVASAIDILVCKLAEVIGDAS
jgi:hypothetical protein